MPNTAANGGNAALYAEIQQFYAHQMQLLDGGDADSWAETFTEDGAFHANGRPQPAVGRETIRAAAAKAKAQHAEEGIQVRHWLGMMDIEERADGSVLARCYALIVNTPRGGQAAVSMSTCCDDVLVRGADGGWLVSHRTVVRDDMR